MGGQRAQLPESLLIRHDSTTFDGKGNPTTAELMPSTSNHAVKLGSVRKCRTGLHTPHRVQPKRQHSSTSSRIWADATHKQQSGMRHLWIATSDSHQGWRCSCRRRHLPRRRRAQAQQRSASDQGHPQAPSAPDPARRRCRGRSGCDCPPLGPPPHPAMLPFPSPRLVLQMQARVLLSFIQTLTAVLELEKEQPGRCMKIRKKR